MQEDTSSIETSEINEQKIHLRKQNIVHYMFEATEFLFIITTFIFIVAHLFIISHLFEKEMFMLKNIIFLPLVFLLLLFIQLACEKMLMQIKMHSWFYSVLLTLFFMSIFAGVLFIEFLL
jgi:hypothetical protein